MKYVLNRIVGLTLVTLPRLHQAPQSLIRCALDSIENVDIIRVGCDMSGGCVWSVIGGYSKCSTHHVCVETMRGFDQREVDR